MSNEIGSRVRYGEAFWRAHVAAECVESAGVLRGRRDSAEGFRQLASEVQSRAHSHRSANCSTGAGA